MTEAEWLAATDPLPMLVLIRSRAGDRKLRLFAVACCRSMFATVQVNPWDRDAVVTAERYADGLTDLDELAEAASSTTSDWTAAFACAEAASVESAFAAAEHASGNAAWEVGSQIASRNDVDEDDNPVTVVARLGEMALQASLARDIFGNPLRPVVVDPGWLTETAVGIARGIYDDRAFERMPILADALQDAGCEDEQVLSHCREPGTHVRGCWVVDLVLGKS